MKIQRTSEVHDSWSNGDATHAHHIFPKRQNPPSPPPTGDFSHPFADDSPDWQYMEFYMRNIESRQILAYLRAVAHRP